MANTQRSGGMAAAPRKACTYARQRACCGGIATLGTSSKSALRYVLQLPSALMSCTIASRTPSKLADDSRMNASMCRCPCATSSFCRVRGRRQAAGRAREVAWVRMAAMAKIDGPRGGRERENGALLLFANRARRCYFAQTAQSGWRSVAHSRPSSEQMGAWGGSPGRVRAPRSAGQVSSEGGGGKQIDRWIDR
eukprot:scaffold4102_cov71-Phaeocystis_antarctica.AAC.1